MCRVRLKALKERWNGLGWIMTTVVMHLLVLMYKAFPTPLTVAQSEHLDMYQTYANYVPTAQDNNHGANANDPRASS